MKLTFDQLQSITLGAVHMEEKEDGIHFHRFTEPQAEFYKQRNFAANVPATAGVRFRLRTDSRRLYLKIDTKLCGTRNYFALDVFVNGKTLGSIQNYVERELPRRYTDHSLSVGEFEQEFQLGEGEKELCIYLPWNMVTVLQEFSLDDGASIIPVKPERKLLCFGDSITQGYDALHPSRRYTAQVADYLGMEEINKGIGGEKYQPELAAMKDDFSPALITVAYGTNDWRHRTKEEFEEKCRGFYKNLVSTYPDTPILAITPLWRTIQERQNFDCGPFRGIHEAICKHTADLPNVTVIDGFDIVPHYSDYFADLTLHPNGAGYDRYFEGLRPYLEKYL